MQQKKVIIIGVALIAVVLILVGVAFAMMGGGDKYTTKMEDGYRYLETGDYDSAILQFRYAIEADNTREDAYYGLYQSYVNAGQTDLAFATLQLGVNNTGSASMRDFMDQVKAVMDVSMNLGTPDITNQLVDDKNVVAVLNTELLELFAAANYGDYCAKYGDEPGTLSNGQYTKHLDAIGATLVYFDGNAQRVIDTARGIPYSEYLPNEIRMDNVTALFGGVRSLSFDQLKNLKGIEDLKRSENTITFCHGGCEVTILCGADGVITASSENYIVPTGEVEKQSAFVLAATIIDATTGGPLSGAKVQAYPGYSTFGNCIEATTDSTGQAPLDLQESGTYTVVISKPGYITEQFEVYVLSNMRQTQQTFTLSPTISGDGIRLVLSWGASPTDLDSYLVGTASDGTYVDVNYTNMVAFDSSSQKVAALDVDDVSSYGPETVTIYDIAGSYEFYVDDFTNSGTISSSGATVKIYVGSALYTTVSIPAGIEDQWHVCTIQNGQVTVTNRSR